jgi:hypothetical protein
MKEQGNGRAGRREEEVRQEQGEVAEAGSEKISKEQRDRLEQGEGR